MQDFRQLRVWEKSHRLALEAYKVTAAFPKSELYGLTSQIRRAAVSIPTNIAEGCGRNTDKDFARFLQISMGSACELEYELLLSHELGLLDEQCHASLVGDVVEVKRMLSGFIKKLRSGR